MTAEKEDRTSVQDVIRQLAQSVLPDSSLFVLDIRVRGSRGSAQVEVIVDGDHGVSIDQCAEISRELMFLLNVKEVFLADFRLSVSSPGVDRSFELPRQYRKSVGKRLSLVVRLGDGVEGALEGVLKAVGDDSFVLETPGGETTVEYGDVVRAKVKLPW